MNTMAEKKFEKSDMMKHYDTIKEKYPDCIVFYRLGDFYEMFFDDAIKVSSMLDLTLTGRDCGLEQRAPMCGIPYHAADEYIAKLVALGEKVAICEQLSEPGKGKGLVERDVIRIVSSGTVTESELIDEGKNNFIACVYATRASVGIAWCDITTGQFYAKSFDGDNAESDLCDHLVRISPAEIICNPQFLSRANEMPVVQHKVIPLFNGYSERAFLRENAENVVREQFAVHSLSVFGIEDDPAVIGACGALLAYLRETQKHALRNIDNVSLEVSSEQMIFDASALRNLELVKNQRDGKTYGTLLWVLDKTITAMGKRMMRNWVLSPLTSPEKIAYRLDGVEELSKSAVLREGLIECLKGIKDTERIAGRISNDRITPKDCETLAKSIAAFPSVKLLLFGVSAAILKDVDKYVYGFEDLSSLLGSAIVENAPVVTKDGGFIKDGFDPELDRLRGIRENAASVIKKMEETEREKTGIKNLKIGYNRVFGYYIEVTNSFKELVPYDYIRKQTLTGGERYITEELKKVEEEILTSSERCKKIEGEIFEKIRGILRGNIKKLQDSSRAIACLDCILSFATVAKENNYVRPTIVPGDKPMNVVQGRHPVVERVSKETFVANDTLLDTDENRVLIVTGPNMAGKSTYMRQNALIAVMAHMGSFVPARSAEIPVIDRIFTRIGASDNLIFDQSTFMVEMTEVASILRHATSKSLLILDEVGRGTSTYDGLSIAWAVVEYLAKTVKAKTLFATHYHELSELEGIIDGVKNYKITVREINGKVVFLRKIMRGSANRSFGIEVASLAGIPSEVTARAKSILKKLEKNDLARSSAGDIPSEDEIEEEIVPALSETEEAIRDADVNCMTPLDALKLISDLKKKLQNNR